MLPIMKKYNLFIWFILPILCFCSKNEINSNTGTFVDSRDGQIYNWVKIGNQICMAENLNFYTKDGSRYYDNDSLKYSHTYGRLYNWETALKSCPVGWHLPSHAEWKELEIYLGMPPSETDNHGKRGTFEGGKLKETGTAHWMSPNYGATNESGFTALPAGYQTTDDDIFWNVRKASIFWSSTEINNSVYTRIITYDLTEIYLEYSPKTFVFSVRCIKD